jgi:predicted AAA+ superfamily ATPase
MTAPSALTPKEARADTVFWGHLVESAVGAHLAAAAAEGRIELFYWRERNHEVDFVVRRGKRVVAIEVKSGRAPTTFPGLAAIDRAFKIQRLLVVGGDGIPLADFLTRPVEHWVEAEA